MFLCGLVFTTHTNQMQEGNCSCSRQPHSRVSLPAPLSADSCVVCHLKQADEGGTHPGEISEACLHRVISSETALILQGLKNFDLFSNSLSLMMYKCMTQFCGFQHLNAGNSLKPILLTPESALTFCPTFFLPPGSPEREFLVHWPLRRGAEMLSFHSDSSDSLRAFLSFESSIKVQILKIR